MLKTINCPSYIKTQVQSSENQRSIDVAQIPYDQFHTLMSDVLAQNRKFVEVNTLVNDLITAARNNDQKALVQIVQRAKAYMENQ